MIKTNQFSPKTQYVTPWCKCADVHTQRLVCASPGSVNHDWYNGTEKIDVTEEEEGI